MRFQVAGHIRTRDFDHPGSSQVRSNLGINIGFFQLEDNPPLKINESHIAVTEMEML